MSNIYIHEPATFGKILLNTTVGDIDIELWSKEAPKTCRNFVQLCLEGYYNGTIFHRVVKGFIVQGGDPEGTGLGGESIYGEPFKDEFHSRLRFVRRGLVAMANSGKDDNGSQFFFTFAPCQELQNKHTIFAKVAGNTLYNMLKLEESLVDQDDRPVYPHKILSCKVISNPFDDIVPRVSQMAEEIMKDEPREKVKKNYSLLSFGEEAEEEEAETDAIVKVYRGKSKSSHDLTKDPKLSSVSVLPLYKESKSESSESHELESIRKKFKKDVGDKLPIPESKPLNVGESSKNSEKVVDDDNRENIRREIKELKRELRKKMLPEKIAEEEEEKKETDKEDEGNPLLAQFHQEIAEYREKTSTVVNSVVDRQKETLNLLAKFQSKIRQAKEKRFEGDENIHVDSDIDKNNYNDDDDDDDDDTWLCHNLYFEEPELLVAKDANMPSVDRFHIHDPRNAMNVRKRQAGKGKKEKLVDNIDKKFNV